MSEKKDSGIQVVKSSREVLRLKASCKGIRRLFSACCP